MLCGIIFINIPQTMDALSSTMPLGYAALFLPLLVRPGAVLPVGAVDDRPDYADGVTLRINELPEGARVRAEIPDAVTFTTTREAGSVRVVRDAGHSGEWSVLLVGVRSAGSVDIAAVRRPSTSRAC